MKIERYLELAAVPTELRPEAIKCMRDARWRMGVTLVAKALAPIFGTLAGLVSKRDAERVPKLLRPWDNNISLNGDSGPWGPYVRDDGVEYTGHYPTPDNKLRGDPPWDHLYNYWYKPGKALPRDRMARVVWLGFRNPASYTAKMMGKRLQPVDIFAAGATTWDEITQTWEYRDPECMLKVLRIQGVWQIIVYRKTSYGFWLKGSWGFKLGNINPDYHPFNPNVRIQVSHLLKPCKAPKKSIFNDDQAEGSWDRLVVAWNLSHVMEGMQK